MSKSNCSNCSNCSNFHENYENSHSNCEPPNRICNPPIVCRGKKTVTEVIASESQFSTLESLLKVTNLNQELPQATVFAPINAAFDALPLEVLNYLKTNPKVLSQILLYHVSNKDISQSKIKRCAKCNDTLCHPLTIDTLLQPFSILMGHGLRPENKSVSHRKLAIIPID